MTLNSDNQIQIFSKILDQKNTYRLKLMSDVELLSYANINISKISDADSELLNLESNIFGSNKTSNCLICGQLKECPGHYGVIQTPYPILTNTLVLNDFLKVIEIICPFCSCVPINNARDALKLKPADRLKWLSDEVKKYKTVIYKCPYCSNVFNFINTSGTVPDLSFYIKSQYSEDILQLNPILIKEIINNIPDQVIEYMGFNVETYNPHNFMTNLITIIPNKLRIKTLETTNSFITNIYKHILKDVLPELRKLYNNNFGNNITIEANEFGKTFNDNYKKLNAWYILFTDSSTAGVTNACLNALSKRDRQHIDNASSMISRLRDKKHNYFENGITSSRHNNSARTVVGGGSNLNSFQIGFPKKYCHKFGHFIPVYKENLDMIKQFVMSMTELSKYDISRVKALKLYCPTTNQTIALKNEKIGMFVNKIQPGDKIYISSIPGNIVQHCRFPCVREESWCSHELVPTDLNIMSLSLSACPYKNADFDGDETQIYKLYSNVLEPECLLLHSPYRQMFQYKDGTIGIDFNCDSKLEIPMMKPGVLISELPIYEPKSNSVIGYRSIYPKIEILDQVDKFFDVITGYDTIENYKTFTKMPKINYTDEKIEIINNRINRKDKYDLMNSSFYSYLIFSLGVERVMCLKDLLIHLGYLMCFSSPITLGNEIKIYKNREEIESIKKEAYEKLKVIEQSDLSNTAKDQKQFIIDQEAKSKALELLVEGAKGTNLYKNKFLPKFGNEMYNSVVAFTSIYIDGKRIRPKLLNHTRTIAGFPRFSTNPQAYGYVIHNYLSLDVQPFETMYDCMLQRKGIYTRGNSTGKSGYLTKRFIMAYGPTVVDSNGALEYQNQFISPCYNNLSINPRYHFELVLDDIDLSEEEFKDKYKGMGLLINLHKQITDSIKEYFTITNFIDNALSYNKFVCGFDYSKFLKSYPEGQTKKEDIMEFLDKIEKVFSPVGMIQRYNLLNLVEFKYFMIINLLKRKLTRQDLIKCYYYFINSLVDSGESVGMKASFAISEVLTQDKLDAIHHATKGGVETDNLQQTKSDQRFEELYGGAQHKNQVITLGFYENDYNAIKKFALENETIYFNSIWTKLEIIVSGRIPKVVKQIHPDIDFDQLKVYNTYIRMICNLNILANYNIKISELFNKLRSNFEKIHFLTGHIPNSHEFIVYIFFDPNITKSEIDDYIYTWKEETLQNIIHGKYLKNCLIVQNRITKEYSVKANMVDDVVYEQFLFNPLFDPSKCKTTNTYTNLSVYGVFEALPRLNEETVYCAKILSSAGILLNEHFKTLSQTSLRNGNYLMAVSTSIDKNDIDYIRDIQFEQPTKFIKSAIKNGKFREITDPIAGECFNECPKIGDGFSKIIVFKK